MNFGAAENIRSLIPWEEYSLEFRSQPATDEEVTEMNPGGASGIILTDINMLISWSELLQKLQTEYPILIQMH